MPGFRWIRHRLAADDDALAPYRTRVAEPLTFIFAALLLPLLALHLMAGRWLLAGVAITVQLLAIACGLAIRRRTVPPWAMTPAILVVIVAIAVAVSQQGTNGLFGAYPALVITYFLVPRLLARACSILLIAAVVVIGGASLDTTTTTRATGTLLLLLAMVEVVLDVMQDLQRALAREACTDALTGAWNRRQLGRLLAAPPPGTGDGDGRGLVLLALDIDHFKRVNDRHGHATGDRVLVETVRLIQRRLRPVDQLFRTGGEEFLVARPDATLDEALALAEALRLDIAAARLLPDGEPVTLSIGVASLRSAADGDRALRDADRALYDAKQAGRDCVRAAMGPVGAGGRGVGVAR